MNWGIVGILMRNELRMLMRYRRTVVLAVVLPLLALPLILMIQHTISERRKRDLTTRIYRYAITGSNAAQVRRAIGFAKEDLAKYPPTEEDLLTDFRFEEVRVPDPEAALRSQKIDFYILAMSGAEADSVDPEELKGEEDKPQGIGASSKNFRSIEPERLPGVPAVRIFYLGDRQDSGMGRANMRALLVRGRRAVRNQLLEERGFPVDPADVMTIKDDDVASKAQVTGSYLGRFITLVLIMLTMTGGSVVAIDSIAGEKERGSLETLLTTAAERGEIVAAKALLVFAVAVFITVLQVGNLLVYVSFKLIELPKDWVINLPPATLVSLLVLFLPLAAFVAALLLLISAYAKSYKEAQLYFFPVYLLSCAPALAGVLPGISLRSAIALVPIANVSVAVREIMVGNYDWPMMGVAFAAMSLAAWGMARASAKMLTQERLITASESDLSDLTGGPALFPKHVLRWFALMLVALFVVALNMPADTSMAVQVALNEIVLFLGASFLMIRWYRLNPREALSLRPVKPIVWLAVLLLIPSGFLVATGVFQLANLVFPVPQKMIEQFSKDLLPKNVPVWQMVLYISILPGICEETAFRGLLLYGLRSKFRPVTLALGVGIIFGFFHVALFRIIPTAFLGVVLTVVALLTGSIFPCMVAHAGNNALGLFLGLHEVPVAKIGWWGYLMAAVVFFLAFLILYRARAKI
jgi:sodium transport system permease protein